ncbi:MULTISPECIES: DUF2760 domain-containing protein [unclassified Polaromonas]|uniref:DUF2760 domain-containing protein n=1 Tax=unclassified Polaromonas TaxID=2638319 RepID=UPI0018CA5FCB|nr:MULTISPECIES: DUF2760 domain-containing protein [unclassified Polaromonas]MBG6073208.1 hypothetical protein [Polaromonas sp. CG_9.7]MBG6115282.1 hypothetical protein [Polaromonas sp. CG_9.2]MDH6183508.1 hypothetical protein [Polaromonas sp. CG_23.6]
MTDPTPSFFKRVSLAFGSFFSTLGDGNYAARVQALREQGDAPAAPVAAAAPAPAPVAPPVFKEATPEAALQLLALLQREARLIDFVQEDLTGYTDAEIGGPARLVHEGCAKVLREHFTLAPVQPEAEGSRIMLNDGFDARAIRLTGNVVGQAPFHGALSHRGWRALDTRLPRLAAGHDASVLAQAEVEL